MFYLEILLLRICVVFLIIKELNKDLYTKIMLIVLLMIMKNWNLNKYFGKIMCMKIMHIKNQFSDLSHGNAHRMSEISRPYNSLCVII